VPETGSAHEFIYNDCCFICVLAETVSVPRPNEEGKAGLAFLFSSAALKDRNLACIISVIYTYIFITFILISLLICLSVESDEPPRRVMRIDRRRGVRPRFRVLDVNPLLPSRKSMHILGSKGVNNNQYRYFILLVHHDKSIQWPSGWSVWLEVGRSWVYVLIAPASHCEYQLLV